MRKKVFIGVALLLVAAMLAACGGIPQEDYDAAVADKKAADAKVTSLTSQLSAAKSEATKAKSDLAAAQSEVTAAQSDLEAAESDLASAKSAASSAQSAASSAKSEVSSLESDLAAAQATIAELEAAAAPVEEEEEVVEEEEEVVEEEEEEVAEEEEEVAEEEEEAAEYEALPAYEHPAEISFDATEIIIEEYGFSIKHPINWSQTSGEGEDYTASRPDSEGYTGMYVGAWDLDGNDTLESFPAVLIAALTEAPVEILKAGPTTLADGTPAYAVEYNCTLSGWGMHSVSVGLIVGDLWIGYHTWNIDMLGTVFDEDWLWEMAHTLTIIE